MPTVDNPIEKTLAELGTASSDEVARLFAQVRARFDSQAAKPLDSATWEALKLTWTGRKSGALTLVTENWLKPAAPDLKRAVGQELNKLKAHVESTLEARKRDVESLAADAASAKDRVDLSLPGVIRPVGTHHLIRQVFQEIEDIFVSIGFSVVEGP
jgi:phenylalanyl-tRNA synthetase alpha chain